MTHRTVTEADFRKPEFIDAKPEDYEIRSDGAVVRKDRWQTAVMDIASTLGINIRNFEIDDVVAEVEALTNGRITEWFTINEKLPEIWQANVVLRFSNGTILHDVVYANANFLWNGDYISPALCQWAYPLNAK